MYNTLTRLQNVFGFFTTVAFTVGLLIAATDIGVARTPSGELTVQNAQVARGRPHYYSTRKEEYAVIRFNLDADLSSLWTWNTKSVFIYVTAEWGGDVVPDSVGGRKLEDTMAVKNSTVNTAVIWDEIITAPSADYLSNKGPATMKKLRKNTKGPIDKTRGMLQLRNQRPKYQITHPSGKIAQTDNMRLRLHYNVQPWVGMLTWDQSVDFGLWKAMKNGVSRNIVLPAVKVPKSEKGTTK